MSRQPLQGHYIMWDRIQQAQQEEERSKSQEKRTDGRTDGRADGKTQRRRRTVRNFSLLDADPPRCHQHHSHNSQ